MSRASRIGKGELGVRCSSSASTRRSTARSGSPRSPPATCCAPPTCRSRPGGKAVNVCRAALTLGAPARLVGPFPGRLGGVAVDLLDAEGLDVTAVPVGGELRGTTVIIEADGRTTVINEPGPPLSDAEWHDVVDAVADGDRRRGASSPSVAASRPASPTVPTARSSSWSTSAAATVAVDVTAATADRGGRRRRRPRQPQPRRSRAGARHRGRRISRWRRARPSTSTTSTPPTSRLDRGPRPRRWSTPEPAPRWCRPVAMASPAGRPPSTRSCRRPRSPSSTRSAPATPCSAPRSSPSNAVGRSTTRSATASPTPPRRSPTRSPATPTRRWSTSWQPPCRQRAVR